MSALLDLGGWFFRNRGWLPVPLGLLLLVPEPAPRLAGFGLLLAGEGLRLWAVGHIGRRSRTRGEAVGELVREGPYARVRNPLYVGNLLIWAGFGVLAWPAALLIVPLLGAYYGVMVRWEEQRLLASIGAPYAEYLASVPRWVPLGAPRPGRWDGREALRSERGTFLVLTILGGALAARCYLGG